MPTQSLANQYNMSDEPGRRDFLDAIFKYMDQKSKLKGLFLNPFLMYHVS